MHNLKKLIHVVALIVNARRFKYSKNTRSMEQNIKCISSSWQRQQTRVHRKKKHDCDGLLTSAQRHLNVWVKWNDLQFNSLYFLIFDFGCTIDVMPPEIFINWIFQLITSIANQVSSNFDACDLNPGDDQFESRHSHRVFSLRILLASSLQANKEIILYNRPRPLFPKTFPIHCSLTSNHSMPYTISCC
jgi:hypothetical protein